MTNVRECLCCRQTLQPCEHRDALAQLPQSRILQPPRQFQLAGKHDLKEFTIRSFKIRQQTHCFERFIRKILGFIDKNDDSPAYRSFSQEKLNQAAVQLHGVVPAAIHTESLDQITEEFC